MGTDNEFTTDVYAMASAQEAGNHAFCSYRRVRWLGDGYYFKTLM